MQTELLLQKHKISPGRTHQENPSHTSLNNLMWNMQTGLTGSVQSSRPRYGSGRGQHLLACVPLLSSWNMCNNCDAGNNKSKSNNKQKAELPEHHLNPRLMSHMRPDQPARMSFTGRGARLHWLKLKTALPVLHTVTVEANVLLKLLADVFWTC